MQRVSQICDWSKQAYSFIIPHHSTLDNDMRRPTRIITRNHIDSEQVQVLCAHCLCDVTSSPATRRCLCSIRFCTDRSGISINPRLTNVHKSHSIRVCVQHAPSIHHPAADDWQRRRNRIVRLVLLNDSGSANGQWVQIVLAGCRHGPRKMCPTWTAPITPLLTTCRFY